MRKSSSDQSRWVSFDLSSISKNTINPQPLFLIPGFNPHTTTVEFAFASSNHNLPPRWLGEPKRLPPVVRKLPIQSTPIRCSARSLFLRASNKTRKTCMTHLTLSFGKDAIRIEIDILHRRTTIDCWSFSMWRGRCRIHDGWHFLRSKHTHSLLQISDAYQELSINQSCKQNDVHISTRICIKKAGSSPVTDILPDASPLCPLAGRKNLHI